MPRLRIEKGMTLIELLIAMVVLAIGVTALVAGLGGGILAVERSANTTIAGTLADQQMETYRQAAFASLALGVQSATTSKGSDGKTYWLRATISWTCPVPPASAANTTTSATPPTCTSTPAVRPVKMVSIDVRDPTTSGVGACPGSCKLLYTETSTFDASTG
jgi:prepilin-type N-terminal cleavage/methylation domain-containing protein